MTIAEQIAIIREELLQDIPYKEIAKFCGVTTHTITHIIKRTGNTPVYTTKLVLERMKELQNKIKKIN